MYFNNEKKEKVLSITSAVGPVGSDVASAAVARRDGSCEDRKIVRWGCGGAVDDRHARPPRHHYYHTPPPPPPNKTDASNFQPPPPPPSPAEQQRRPPAAAVAAVCVRWCYLKPRAAGNRKIHSYWYVYSFWQFFRWFTNVYFHGHSSSTAGESANTMFIITRKKNGILFYLPITYVYTVRLVSTRY